MNITHVTKHRKIPGTDNQYVGYTYYRLSESYRNEKGSTKRTVLGLGELAGTTQESRQILAELLTGMIQRNALPLCDDPKLMDLAYHFYNLYQTKKLEEEESERKNSELQKAAEEKKAQERAEYVQVKLKSLKQFESRTVGAETIALWAADKLWMRKTLLSLGLSQDEADMGLMQIVARAVYPGSELRTVRCLKENSALCELLNIEPEHINKDRLYRSALKLWDVHRELEDCLHSRVCNLFNLEEKLYLFDLTNTYFEGRMESSELCKFGRSKEKRGDCKIIVLAAVVNSDGLLVRTEIFEGNMSDQNTLATVIGSLVKGLSKNKRIVVIDSGFCTKENLEWLKDNGYDYITVMHATGVDWEPASDIIVRVRDNRKQAIKLQKVKTEKTQDTVLLVESPGKTLKEQSMANQARSRYEEGLKAIQRGISGKGTKKRDAVQRRLGRLQEKYPSAHKCFDVVFEYDDKDRATEMRYTKKCEEIDKKDHMHGKYLLQTSLPNATSEENIWTYYNTIRQVEETFKTLKSYLDMRPVFHKTDNGSKAHLNLVVLAYWLVSLVRYTLRMRDINVRWEEIIRIGSAQVRVTSQVELKGNRLMNIRQSTEPEQKMQEMFSALGIRHQQKTKIKFVGPQKPVKKIDLLIHRWLREGFAQCGLRQI